MVDEDKQACHTVAEQGYCAGLWPEAYITWDFLKQYPKAMEPRYLLLNWNDIPGHVLPKALFVNPGDRVGGVGPFK